MGHRADLDAPGLDGHPPGHPATGQVLIVRRVCDLDLVGPTSHHGHRRPPRPPVTLRAPCRSYVTTRPRPVAPRGPRAPLRPLRWQSMTGDDRAGRPRVATRTTTRHPAEVPSHDPPH